MRMIMTGQDDRGLTPYERGEAAYNRGETFSDNPYRKGTKEYDEWVRGMSSDGDPGL